MLVWREWDGEFLVYSAASGQTHNLNFLAGEALRSLEAEPGSVSEVVCRLAHQFEIAEIYGRATAGIIKDTVVAPSYGRVSVDFTADQPGPTLFHCHIQHHMDYGFKALLKYA